MDLGGRSGGEILMSTIQYHSKKAAFGVASGGMNPAYKHRLHDVETLILRFRGDESFASDDLEFILHFQRGRSSRFWLDFPEVLNGLSDGA